MGAVKSCIPFLGQPTCYRIPSYERYSRRLGYRCNVQAMVFGNMAKHQVQVLHLHVTHLPVKKGIYGEYLINAQGEGRSCRCSYTSANQQIS